MKYSKPLLRLIEEFQKFPGVGPRSAQRMAFHLLNQELKEIEEFSKIILEAKTQIKKCSVCQNLTTNDPCEICSTNSRMSTTICVVSKPNDLIAIEKTSIFKGVYHVLGGLISPLDGVGPENLTIKSLLGRANKNNVGEVILALDTST